MNIELLKSLVVLSAFLRHLSKPGERDLANTISFRPQQCGYMEPAELVTIREEMDLTQDAMAVLMNTTQSNISKMEHGIIRIRKRRADKARQLHQHYVQTQTKLAS